MRYCEYDFYKTNYSGTMPVSTFNRLSIKASAYIKSNTFNRITEPVLDENVKYCMCDLVDKMLKIEKREGKKSESVGTWSTAYVESAEDKQELYNTLLDYLDLSLLYRGC